MEFGFINGAPAYIFGIYLQTFLRGWFPSVKSLSTYELLRQLVIGYWLCLAPAHNPYLLQPRFSFVGVALKRAIIIGQRLLQAGVG